MASAGWSVRKGQRLPGNGDDLSAVLERDHVESASLPREAGPSWIRDSEGQPHEILPREASATGELVRTEHDLDSTVVPRLASKVTARRASQ